MRIQWYELSEQEQTTFRVVRAFIDSRLDQRETIDWALKLGVRERSSRLAVLESVDDQRRRALGEPWSTAWRILEESWEAPNADERASLDGYDLQLRIKSGERSGALIAKIVDLVRPTLDVEALSTFYGKASDRTGPIRSVDDLFRTGLTSKRLENPDLLQLDKIDDPKFLFSLAAELDAAVSSGLEVARRNGWSEAGSRWRIGQLNRVYYVPEIDRGKDEHEPDEFHRGIAPSVKTLYAVVERLLELDTTSAFEFIERWRISRSEIYKRLWAAISRDARAATPEVVASMLKQLNDVEFWEIHWFPEFSELRAKRYSDLSLQDQSEIAARIRKLPPKRLWPKVVTPDEVVVYRESRSIQELRRISLAGGKLPLRDEILLDLEERSEPSRLLKNVDDGFLKSPKATFVAPNSEGKFDLLIGEHRLKAIESSLRSKRMGLQDDPAQRARDWMQQDQNVGLVLADLETATNSGEAFPNVWEWFGWIHKPSASNTGSKSADASGTEGTRVLSLIANLPLRTISDAIDGIAHWLSTWERVIAKLPESFFVWEKIWPVAVNATNAAKPSEPTDFEMVESDSRQTEEAQPKDLDTLNSPVGKLTGVFLASCPSLNIGPAPFDADVNLKTMLYSIVASTGRAKLIGTYRLIEELDYFLNAAPAWAQLNLVEPLNNDNAESIALWRAIGRRTRFTKTLRNIGRAMSIRATDRRLGRETQKSLATSLIVEVLHSHIEKREPVIATALITQMIRSVDDEIRAHLAGVLSRFVKAVSSANSSGISAYSAEQIFRESIEPFLQNIWPQERSLSTPGISREFADLPSATKGMFAEAVEAIERFIVPFDCWSMIDFGLYGEESGLAKLGLIDSFKKAKAFLHLLDLTIGNSEGSVIPSDLSDALAQIDKVAQSLSKTDTFRRLSTAANRS